MVKVTCFDCGVSDWMKQFHYESSRSFCDRCYQKRIQPERSKREDAKIRLENAKEDKRVEKKFNPFVTTSNSIPMW
jgi:hypothetical protein